MICAVTLKACAGVRFTWQTIRLRVPPKGSTANQFPSRISVSSGWTKRLETGRVEEVGRPDATRQHHNSFLAAPCL